MYMYVTFYYSLSLPFHLVDKLITEEIKSAIHSKTVYFCFGAAEPVLRWNAGL